MIKKILVPFDGSKLAEKILPQVEEMAKSLQAKIILITVGSLLWAVPAAESGLRGAEEFAAQKKIEAEKKSLKWSKL
jgi:nucleotide-binding universal stress UspA family protein